MRHSTPKKQEQAPSSSLPFDDGFVAKVVSEAGLWRKFPFERAGGEIEVGRRAGETGEDGGKREVDSRASACFEATTRVPENDPRKSPWFQAPARLRTDDKKTLPQPASRNGKGTPHDHRRILPSQQPPPEGGRQVSEITKWLGCPRLRRPAGSLVRRQGDGQDPAATGVRAAPTGHLRRARSAWSSCGSWTACPVAFGTA